MKQDNELRLIDHLKYQRDLILGKSENKELIIAARANIAGFSSLMVAIAGVINGRLDITALGASLMIISGVIMYHAVQKAYDNKES